MYVPAASMCDAASIPATGLDHDAHGVVKASLRKSSEGSREPGRQAFSVGLDSKAVSRGQCRMEMRRLDRRCRACRLHRRRLGLC